MRTDLVEIDLPFLDEGTFIEQVSEPMLIEALVACVRGSPGLRLEQAAAERLTGEQVKGRSLGLLKTTWLTKPLESSQIPANRLGSYLKPSTDIKVIQHSLDCWGAPPFSDASQTQEDPAVEAQPNIPALHQCRRRSSGAPSRLVLL